MKIEQIEIYKSENKLKKPFITSLGLRTSANNIIVIIKTDVGFEGIGECSPFMPINGESIDTGFIVGKYFADKLLGVDPLKIEECHNIMDKIIYGNTSIKSAFDIALYDIVAQYNKLPLYKYLGGKKNKKLYTDYTVSLQAPVEMAKEALIIKNEGFPVIKVKLGGTKIQDINRIKTIRKSVGHEIPIRIDANQGWNTNDAVFVLKALAPYNIQYCEEPIPRYKYMDLPLISKESPIPVMADESCSDEHDAERLIKIKACKYFNLKLGKSSGFYRALKIIKLAEKANILMQVGGFLESKIGFTASAHLALVSKNILFCDFDSPLMFEKDNVIGGITYSKNGLIVMPDKPGLGLHLDKNTLELLPKLIIS